MDILQKIREIYPSLTRKQKSIADYLLENPEDICYITLAQLSRQTCASELTLLRFCAKLGCSSFLELKQEFREHTQQMIRLLSAPAFFVPENASDSSAKTELLYELCRQEAGAATDFAASFQPESIIAAAQEIRKSRRIFIFAHDISKVPGEFLKSRLLLLSFQIPARYSFLIWQVLHIYCPFYSSIYSPNNIFIKFSCMKDGNWEPAALA